jgi:hypothetical protein
MVLAATTDWRIKMNRMYLRMEARCRIIKGIDGKNPQFLMEQLDTQNHFLVIFIESTL